MQGGRAARKSGTFEQRYAGRLVALASELETLRNSESTLRAHHDACIDRIRFALERVLDVAQASFTEPVAPADNEHNMSWAPVTPDAFRSAFVVRFYNEMRACDTPQTVDRSARYGDDAVRHEVVRDDDDAMTRERRRRRAERRAPRRSAARRNERGDRERRDSRARRRTVRRRAAQWRIGGARSGKHTRRDARNDAPRRTCRATRRLRRDARRR